MQILTFWVLYN